MNWERNETGTLRGLVCAECGEQSLTWYACEKYEAPDGSRFSERQLDCLGCGAHYGTALFPWQPVTWPFVPRPDRMDPDDAEPWVPPDE